MIKHPNLVFHAFETRAAMVDAICAATLQALEHDLERSGSAAWAVSGGSTPKPLFEAISRAELNWPAVDIALVDERWVAPGHPRSNESFAQNSLMQGKAAEATLTGMYVGDRTIEDALPAIEARYRQMALPFSNILLGMGGDGHTASLFPGAEGLERAMQADNPNVCAAIKAKQSAVTGEEVDRITLTFAAIAQAKSCFLMITGEEKLAVLERALTHAGDLPIARVINGLSTPLDIYWAP